jgi:hypothetical protein
MLVVDEMSSLYHQPIVRVAIIDDRCAHASMAPIDHG